ncbi:MAG: sigma-54 dependent transcriptional regulator [Acidobacteriota bacterium]
MTSRILIIDDEIGIRETLSSILQDEGYEAVAVETAKQAEAIIGREHFDLAILDIWLPDGDGLDLLERLRASHFDRPIVMISGHANIDSAVKAIRLGAYDFLEKPLSLSRVVLTVQHALEQSQLVRQLDALSTGLEQDELLIGESDGMTELKEQLAMAARSDSRLLITGENGTGKELVARQVHRLSGRAHRPFVAVNCAAIPEELIESELFGHVRGAFTGATSNRRGRFEQADSGTLFLDEVADMSLMTQAKVLRVVEEQSFEPVGGQKTVNVDVRLLAATNKDLEAEIAAGRFREDLFFRLAVIPLKAPALRERREDIPRLIEHFLALFASKEGRAPMSIERPALERLIDYPWPGNVRELRNLTERLSIMVSGDAISVRDLPPPIRGENTDRVRTAIDPSATLKDAREAFEKSFIESRLKANGGNVSQTAKALGIERSHLHRKMRSLGIEADRD